MSFDAQNLHYLHRIIDAAKAAAKRSADEVTLLAVSKTQPTTVIRQAFAAGQRDFAESYLQEALTKQNELADLPIIWHFIGSMQSNKTKQLAERFAWFHALEREKIARRLHEQRPQHLAPLNVCIQVNLAGEVSKSGVSPDACLALAKQVAGMNRLRLRGLMCIPEADLDDTILRIRFAALAELAAQIKRAGMALDTLSMGMSADFPLAIDAGATMVRIGSALFGARN